MVFVLELDLIGFEMWNWTLWITFCVSSWFGLFVPNFPKLHGMHPHPLQIEEEERSKILILKGQFFQRGVKEFFGKMKKIMITEWKKTTVIYFKGGQ